MTIHLQGEELILDKERALFLPKHRMLAISDLHLGKSAHFRSAGIQVPNTVAQHDLNRLGMLMDHYSPQTLLINGDMFHHGLNSDIDDFERWRARYTEVNFLLVKGNHDRLSPANYTRLGINIHEPSFCLGPFCFIHDAPKCTEEELYPISGHIHPGVTVTGRARQRLRFPCFYFGSDFAILPAFSVFTGLSIIRPSPEEQVFAITPGGVVQV